MRALEAMEQQAEREHQAIEDARDDANTLQIVGALVGFVSNFLEKPEDLLDTLRETRGRDSFQSQLRHGRKLTFVDHNGLPWTFDLDDPRPEWK